MERSSDGKVRYVEAESGYWWWGTEVPEDDYVLMRPDGTTFIEIASTTLMKEMRALIEADRHA